MRRLLPFLLVGVVFVVGCKTKQEDTLEQIAVSPNSVSIWSIGNTATLQAEARTASGKTLSAQPDFTWSSSNPDVATVDAAGSVTALTDGEAVITASAEGVSGTATVKVTTTGATVSGQIRYQDKEYSAQGFNVEKVVYKPVRFALVDLVDAKGNVMDSVTTDAQGLFTIGPFVPEEASLRVIAKTDSSTGLDAEVADLSGNLFAVTQSLSTVTDGDTVNIDIPHAARAGAFNILDVMTNGAQFVQSLSGSHPPPLAVYWDEGNSKGTYYCTGLDYSYCPQGAGMYIYNGGAYNDTDEFDDDVLLHEFGHFVAEKFSKDDSPGGCHLLSSNDLDLRLSWSEGWGDFFPAAVKSWLAASLETAFQLSTAAGLPNSYYVDTSGSSVLIAIDIANPAGASDPYLYSSNEIAVAKVLWGINQSFGMTGMWNVMQQYLPGITTPVNMEAFWDGWLTVNAPGATDLSNLHDLFAERQIHYQADAYESDDALSGARSVSLGSQEVHYLYLENGDDRDVVAFDAVAGSSYRIETSGLRNGADTFLRLRNPDGTELATNDDYSDTYYGYDSQCVTYRYRNTTTALASRIDFVAPVSGTYTVEVTTTPDEAPYPSAGRYGTYTLHISAQ